MIVKVHMLAYTDGEIREVEIPEIDSTVGRFDFVLGMVFFYGQNDVQPQELPSVSVGDVIEYEGRFHRVEPLGFKELASERAIPRGERALVAYQFTKGD